MWRVFALCVLMPWTALADGPSAATPKAAESPQEQLRTARAALEARGSVTGSGASTGSPNPLTQVVEFAGKRQRWITEFNDDGSSHWQEIHLGGWPLGQTRYVGTYFDIGAPITIDFPPC